jgi:lipopolysaccharide/colanic/teichoic acid biosynthesis glycosyltransferase
MSLVGPRPERPFFVQRFAGQMPHYHLRHTVRPGITGWAQVHGWRGNTSIQRRLEHDLYYVRRQSLRLDATVLLWTPYALLFPGLARARQEGPCDGASATDASDTNEGS